MNRIPSEFENLMKQAEELVKSDLSAKQVVVVQTLNKNIYYFLNHDLASSNMEEENHFIKTLKKNTDTKIQYAVCMWNDFTLDILSYHLRNMLVEMNPSNLETEILLSGEGLHVKSLKVCMPSIK